MSLPFPPPPPFQTPSPLAVSQGVSGDVIILEEAALLRQGATTSPFVFFSFCLSSSHPSSCFPHFQGLVDEVVVPLLVRSASFFLNAPASYFKIARLRDLCLLDFQQCCLNLSVRDPVVLTIYAFPDGEVILYMISMLTTDLPPLPYRCAEHAEFLFVMYVARG